MYAVEPMRESAGRMYNNVCVLMAGTQTLVGAGPVIAVSWYQGYDTTESRIKQSAVKYIR